MKNRPTFKIFGLGLTFGLSLLSGSAMSDTQTSNMFLPSYSTTEIITVAFKGKPPYRNRHQFLAKLRAQEAARTETESLEKTELSAMEIGEKANESPVTGKSLRKSYGHPYHR